MSDREPGTVRLVRPGGPDVTVHLPATVEAVVKVFIALGDIGYAIAPTEQAAA